MGPPAIAFDIDGVFKAGRYFFPDGLKALAECKAAGTPVAFVTNGGGGLCEKEYLEGFKKKIYAAAPEEDKAAYAGALDGIGVESMILSYTPMGEDPDFKHKRILLVGDPKEKVKAVAASYGWTNFLHVSDYCAQHSSVDPFAEARGSHLSHCAVAQPGPPAPTKPAGSSTGDAVGSQRHAAIARRAASSGGDGETPSGGSNGGGGSSRVGAALYDFEAVVVMTDPHDWFEALQATVDVVVSADPNSDETMEFDIARAVPVHFSNPDIFWKARHPQPRFGQGGFRLALEALLRARLNLLKAPPASIDIVMRQVVTQWGKPSLPTLRCAMQRLDKMHTAPLLPPPAPPSGTDGGGGGGGVGGGDYWMVGDNPASDMALSALGGGAWRGCLVRTGVFVDGDAQCGADAVADGVSGAVRHILATAAAPPATAAAPPATAAE